MRVIQKQKQEILGVRAEIAKELLQIENLILICKHKIYLSNFDYLFVTK